MQVVLISFQRPECKTSPTNYAKFEVSMKAMLGNMIGNAINAGVVDTNSKGNVDLLRMPTLARHVVYMCERYLEERNATEIVDMGQVSFRGTCHQLWLLMAFF